MTSLKEDEKTLIIYRQWLSPSPKAAVLLVHGLGAHSGRWQFLADFLLKKDISCYALELRGFGKTKDMRGHIDSFGIYFNDISRLYSIIARENPGRKVFLAGESMGAIIAYLSAIKMSGIFNGLVCISPAIRSALPFTFLEYMRMLLLLVFSPRKQIRMPFSSQMCTRDVDYQKVMDATDLEHRLATPKMLLNIGLAQARLLFLRNKLKAPLFFLVAGSDRLVDSEASKSFFKSLSIEDKELIEYPGMYHALSVEYGKEKVFEDISGWILKRV